MAARAGVSKGTLFLYFPSKEELFKAVVRENIAGRFAEWNNELESFVGTTSEVLRYCYQVWWERIGATKASGITKLMLSEAQNFPKSPSSISKRSSFPARRWSAASWSGALPGASSAR